MEEGRRGDNGVWFIDESTKKYTSSIESKGTGIEWDNSFNMDNFSPQCLILGSPGCPNSVSGNLPHAADSKVGAGIEQYTNASRINLGFGGFGGWLRSAFSSEDYNNSSPYIYYIDKPNNILENFYAIGEDGGNPYYSDADDINFVDRLTAGFRFKWRQDPTETVYTVTSQTYYENNVRFGRSDETSLAYRNDMMREVSDLSEKVSYMSGRLNGHGKHG